MAGHIDKEFWNHLGVDADDRLKKFHKYTQPFRSLGNRVKSQALFSAIQTKFPHEASTKFAYFKWLYETQSEVCDLLHLALVYAHDAEEAVVAEVYQATTTQSAPDKITALFHLLLDGELEKIKHIHYRTLLNKKTWITFATDEDVDADLTSLDIDDVEKVFRKVSKGNRALNVWYILEDGDETAFFIFREGRSRGKYAPIYRKAYQFYAKANPIIFSLSKNGKNLLLYHGADQQSTKLAIGWLEKIGFPDIEYVLASKSTKDADVNAFIDAVANNRDSQLELREIVFRGDPNIHDGRISIEKFAKPLKGAIDKISSALQTSIDAGSVERLTLLFENRRFFFMIDDADEPTQKVITCSIQGGGIADWRKFQRHLQAYSISINKKGR